MQKITPFLWFDNQAEEAANFYVALFSHGPESSSKILNSTVYNEESAKVSGMPKNSIMTVSFQLEGQDFTALNGGPIFKLNNSISFFVSCETRDEIDNLWAGLSSGGKILMGIDSYPFSERFGWVQDKFGVSWQLNLSKRSQKITPFLWYNNHAESAIKFYTSLFRNSNVTRIEHFGAGERGPEGAVKHASFSLNGQEFMAMDSNTEPFSVATSFYVNCDNQEEVDEFWDKLTEEGKPSQCGWLEDKYGVSWQIIPTAFEKLMTTSDAEKSRRVMKALLGMKKIDIKTLESA